MQHFDVQPSSRLLLLLLFLFVWQTSTSSIFMPALWLIKENLCLVSLQVIWGNQVIKLMRFVLSWFNVNHVLYFLPLTKKEHGHCYVVLGLEVSRARLGYTRTQAWLEKILDFGSGLCPKFFKNMSKLDLSPIGLSQTKAQMTSLPKKKSRIRAQGFVRASKSGERSELPSWRGGYEVV